MEQGDCVSIICISFNHEKWIEKALDSVLCQSFPLMELIIADNSSTDQTPSLIHDWVEKHSDELPIKAIFKPKSIGYCALFNELLERAKGAYVVDLSGDDFLYPQHLSLSIAKLKENSQAAFAFSNAHIQEENGAKQTYYQGQEISELKGKVLGREFYEMLIRRSFISSPTVIFRSESLKEVGGYDELLSYEDFDIQLRLTRHYPVVFSDHIGVFKRKHSESLSANQYRRYHSEMLPSTLRVCEKIRNMNRENREDLALQERVLYELKHALWSANFTIAAGFVELANQLRIQNFQFNLYKIWLRLKLDISWLYAKLT